MKKVPSKLEIGDRIYFVKRNEIESSMRYLGYRTGKIHCDVTDRNWGGYSLMMDDLRMEDLPITVGGFQGFRYKWW